MCCDFSFTVLFHPDEVKSKVLSSLAKSVTDVIPGKKVVAFFFDSSETCAQAEKYKSACYQH